MLKWIYKKNTLMILVLLVSLLIAAPAAAADATLPEVRTLLEEQYVDPVPSEVLTAPSIQETLQKLGDPYTVYMTAEEYQNFIQSIDMSVTGIGVYIKIAPEGIRISSIIRNSPAEEVGLQAGDIITKADGQSLAGLSQEKAVGLIKGPEGTAVWLSVLRNGTNFNLEVPRRVVEIPNVEGKIVHENIGYMAIHTFGEKTPAEFDQAVKELKNKGAKAWIVDLRDNPGGYLTTALSLAGYFIGDQTALQTKDSKGIYQAYLGQKQEITLSEPTIFLTNENSASASEILTSVVKDYDKATILGNKTYGKGSVQTLFPLSDGSVLKMTVAKFFSPYRHEINGVGVSPDIPIVNSDSEKAAELLLASTLDSSVNANEEDRVQVFADNKSWKIPLKQAQTPDYWQAYAEMMGNVGSAYTHEELEKGWPLYYPDYQELNGLQDVPLDKKFTVTFSGPINWETVTAQSLELIEKESGERVPLEFKPLSDDKLQVIPGDLLKSGKTYWMVVHRTIQDQKGESIRENALAVIKTAASDTPVQIQASRSQKPPQSELLKMSDYGQAIMDIGLVKGNQ
ncbi:S41 family peptidase [Desulfitobacterium sp.]|uniref:S41 family peptidase n=1 Tax=Desulfitobacterium sp. TaxID=49981 RepID=UPI002B200581|nr:S41 family peptidase [Desulfitobacterium sp.]MEA4902245.1 S41 family peptidase [Desulfitobacterium sp.]